MHAFSAAYFLVNENGQVIFWALTRDKSMATISESVGGQSFLDRRSLGLTS